MFDLDEFDSDFAPASAAEVVREARIFNGIYTLTCPDGSHRTFKISTKSNDAKFAPGKRILYMLVGPDNTSDYEGFAFVTEWGINVWHRYRGELRSSKWEEFAQVIWDIAADEKEVKGFELVVAGTCLRCNRLLTDPISIARGIGPVCDGMVD